MNKIYEMFKNVKMLLLDVDGIMTDGTITYTNSGDELKSFSVKDGLGIRLLIDSGIPVGIITARESEIVKRRSKELGITHVFQNMKNKISAFEKIQKEMNIQSISICYMGDDLIDIPVLKTCSIPVTVPNSCTEVQNVCVYITKCHGGKGAVREVCELILKSQDKWDNAIKKFLVAGDA